MSKDKPIYGYRRKGNTLVPDTPYDVAALDGIAEGELVRVETRQWRNAKRNAAYWSMLRDCIDATGCALNTDVLHDAVKLATGHVHLCRMANGMTVAVPASIAFDKMTEAEMIKFMQAAELALARDYGFSGKERAAA
jgi:hypothetical protein